MRGRPGAGRAALVGLILVCQGCASGRPPAWSAWDEAELRVPNRVIPRLSPVLAAEAERVSQDRKIELAVLQFGPERRRTSDRWPPGVGWPIDVQDVWLRHGGALERALAVDHEVGRRALMQARVATEVELDQTTARFGPTPPAVAERLGRVFGLITHHMKTARELARRPLPTDFLWPVNPVVVTSGFGYRLDPLTTAVRFHAGVDLGGSRGDVVSAASLGRITHAGWLGGYGQAVIVEHTGGLQTLYGHLGQVLVALGAEIRAGDALGLMGSSGRSTAPHLHFEVRRTGEPVDPLSILGLHGGALTAIVGGDDDG